MGEQENYRVAKKPLKFSSHKWLISGTMDAASCNLSVEHMAKNSIS